MKKRAVLAAGGTGGHLFPAISLAQELQARHWDIMLLTDDRGQKYIDKTGFVFRRIASGTPNARGLKKLAFGFKLMIGIVQAYRYLKRFKPECLIGFGGYPSVPGVIAARFLGIPIILHEQNAVLGRANRFLGRFARTIALSFEQTEPKIHAAKFRWTGNPVRAEIRAMAGAPFPSLDLSPFNILVLGGSQGSRIFSEVIPAAVGKLPEDIQARLHITQQCRPETLNSTQEAYHSTKATVTLKSFFDNIPELMARSHLIIARAGASTVFEIAVAGRPAIFVPLPTATDNHQHKNALVVEAAGGGWVISQKSFTPALLATRLETLSALAQTLKGMGEKAQTCGRPDAAAHLADLVEATAAMGASTPVQTRKAERDA